MKRVLMYASVASMIEQFNMPNIQLLQSLDCQVDVACNFESGNTISEEKIVELQHLLATMGVKYYQISIPRKISNIGAIKAAYYETKKLLNENKYDLIHCHSPIGGAICRLANRNSNGYKNTKMIYTAHGFHFYKGNTKVKNFIFRSIERYAAKYTDILITINNEDNLAAKKFCLRKNGVVEYLPGVGVNEKYYKPIFLDNKYKSEIGILEDDFIILSVGELNNNKNHELIIRSVHAINDTKVHYIIVGIGVNKNKYLNLVKELGIEKQVHILGFRNDIRELQEISNLFAFPSIREGLAISGVEALACGNAIIGLNTRGVSDYIDDGKTGFIIENNVESCKNAIIKYMNLEQKEKNIMSLHCKEVSQKFSLGKVQKIMKKIYMKGLE